MSRKGIFDCADCGTNTNTINEYYMIHNHIWDSVAKFKEMLCIGCLENRLGRQLVPSDFTDAPINHGYFEQSERLKSRIRP